MNETTKIDLASFSDKELAGLIPKIEKELERRREQKQKEALAKMREIAEEIGMTPEEILGLGGGGGKRRRKGKRERTVWQHPDDPDKVYRGGRKPEWLRELEEDGREALKVDDL